MGEIIQVESSAEKCGGVGGEEVERWILRVHTASASSSGLGTSVRQCWTLLAIERKAKVL